MRLESIAMAASADGAERAAVPHARGGARRVVISPPPDRERMFAAAKRRSARVRVLRRAIPIVAFGSVAAMIAIAIFDPFGPKIGSLSFDSVSLDGTKVAMAKPKLAGFRADGQPYVLTAERALQDVKNPTVAELQNLVGDMGTAGGETTRLTADTGVYDTTAERMKLIGNVKIAGARFEVRLRSADIDFRTGVYHSNEPVEVHIGGDTTVLADSATARNNGQELVFEGRVRTTVNPKSDVAEGGTKRTGP